MIWRGWRYWVLAAPALALAAAVLVWLIGQLGARLSEDDRAYQAAAARGAIWRWEHVVKPVFDACVAAGGVPLISSWSGHVTACEYGPARPSSVVGKVGR